MKFNFHISSLARQTSALTPPMAPLLLLLFLLFITTASSTITNNNTNPFTPKSSFLRYYARKNPRDQPLPTLLLSKLSPLSALSASLPFPPSSLPSFCAAADILCPSTTMSTTTTINNNNKSNDFSTYASPRNFTNYGTSLSGGRDSFSAYTPDLNLPVTSFRRYSRSSVSRPDSFSSYSTDANVASSSFSSYASSSSASSGSFSSYAHNANLPSLTFSSYDSDGLSRPRSFSSYSDDTNSGAQSFSSYSKRGNAVPTAFTSYATDTNVIGSTFTNYGEDRNGGADNFTSYGADGNRPVNRFKSYGEGGNGEKESFKSYREKANVGEDSFRSYAEHGNAASADFQSYGKSFNPGVDSFRQYGDLGGPGTNPHHIGFTTYAGDNTTFTQYAKTSTGPTNVVTTFAGYKNASVVPSPPGTFSHNRWIEKGKFFRESSLKRMTVIAMADIRDKLPRRSFLPRSISGRLPFSAPEVGRVLAVEENTALGKAMANTVAECERAPSKGETKRCVTSAEDMVDFAMSVLGNNVVARATENVEGWGRDVLVGDVKGINGGRVTKSVSCHQSLFPYLVYYCHSVPRVRVYEVDILDVASKKRINRGVAICHLDTSDWSSSHGAFLALGSRPGEIEVCHWIFEGDMTWAVAD